MSTPTTAVQLLILDREDLDALLDLNVVIESQREAFVALADGTGQLAPRLLLPAREADVSFCYAARVSPHTGAVCKFGSVNPRNPSIGLPTVSALVLVQDPETGRPIALLDGDAVTVARTSAATVLAASVWPIPARRSSRS